MAGTVRTGKKSSLTIRSEKRKFFSGVGTSPENVARNGFENSLKKLAKYHPAIFLILCAEYKFPTSSSNCMKKPNAQVGRFGGKLLKTGSKVGVALFWPIVRRGTA